MDHSHSLARITSPRVTLATTFLAATLSLALSGRAETFSDMGLTHYLHHKLGFHDYLYGPGGVVPRYTGIPEQVPTQQKVSLLRGTYPVGPYRRPAKRTVPGRTTRLDDLNLLVTLPRGPWTRIDPQQSGSRARFLATRAKPTIMISLGGEPIGIDTDITCGMLLAESQQKMLGLPGATIEPGERQQSAAGIPGVAYNATAASGDSTIYYSLWVAAHHGYTYILAVYGSEADRAAVDATMQNVLTGLKQVQSNRVARAGGNQKSATR
jgi:hypothetical protein